MPSYNRKIIVHLSDTHGGNSLGLRMPWTKLQSDEGGQEKNLNECQLHLYGIYEAARQKIIEIAEKDDIVLLHSGDTCQGNKYQDDRETGLIADDIIIARDNFIPFCDLPNIKVVRIIKGTGAHNFGGGSAEILVAELLKQQYSNLDIRAYNHGLINLDGFTIDDAHHRVGFGKRIWLNGNEARFYLRDLMMHEISMGNRPCDLYLGGHIHTYLKEIVWMEDRRNEYESMILISPSMCMMGSYVAQVSQSQFWVTNGMVAIEIINNKINHIYKLMEKIDIRTKEEICLTKN